AWISTNPAVLPTSRVKPPDLRSRTSLNSSTRMRWTFSVVASTVAIGSLARRLLVDGWNRSAARRGRGADLRFGQAQDVAFRIGDQRELGRTVRAEPGHDHRPAEGRRPLEG